MAQENPNAGRKHEPSTGPGGGPGRPTKPFREGAIAAGNVLLDTGKHYGERTAALGRAATRWTAEHGKTAAATTLRTGLRVAEGTTLVVKELADPRAIGASVRNTIEHGQTE